MKDSKLFRFFQLGGYTPTNLENFNYIPTYVGQPLEAQKMVGDRMLDLFQGNLAQATAIDIMNAQRQVVDGDNEANQEISKRYKEELDAIAKSGDYENMTMRVNALARKYQTDSDVRAVSESRANWDRQQKIAEEIRMKTGRDPLFMGDASKHKTIGYDENGKKTYNVFRSSAEAPLDWQAKRQDIWKTIEPNMGPLTKEQVKKTLSEIPGYITTGTWRGIGDQRIKNFLDEAMSAYEGTPEYRQELRYLKETNPEGNAEQQIKTRVLKEGLLKTFSQTDPQYMKDWILEDQMAKAGAMPSIPNYEEMPAIKIKDLVGFDPDDHSESVRVDEAYKTSAHGFNMFGADIAQTDTYIGKKRNIPESEVKARNEAARAGVEVFGGPELAKQAAEQGSAFLNTPQADAFAKQYAELVKTRYQFPTVQPYPADLSKAETFQLQNFLNNRVVLDLDNPDQAAIPTSDGASLTGDFMELIGGKASNLTVSGFVNPKNSYGKLSGNPAFADAQVVTVHDEKGGTQKQLLISRPAGYYKTQEGQAKRMLNVLWNNLALNPGKMQAFNLEGLEVEAKTIPNINDPSGAGDKILVYKVGANDYSDNPIEAPSYESIISAIFSMQK